MSGRSRRDARVRRARPPGARLRSRQRGVHIVEFTLASGLFLFLLFASMEMARLMYAWSALDAITQRGARVAAVCARGDQRIAQYALFGDDGSSPLLPGISTGNIAVDYLNADGGAAGAGRPIYVRVRITDYRHQMFIPATISGWVTDAVTAPAFATTRPAESLGRNPDTGQDVCFA